jgi:hypothetical protein
MGNHWRILAIDDLLHEVQRRHRDQSVNAGNVEYPARQFHPCSPSECLPQSVASSTLSKIVPDSCRFRVMTFDIYCRAPQLPNSAARDSKRREGQTMTNQIKRLVPKWNSGFLVLAMLCGVVGSVPLFAQDDKSFDNPEQAQANHEHCDRKDHAPAKLVQIVREATKKFIDVNAATQAQYHLFLGCVSGPDYGAMGVHYVNGDLVSDGLIDATQPEALIYEPEGERMRLVGVEYIVDAATWLTTHKNAPVLEGQVFQFVDSPNRFGLAPFFELHVWAWRDNPKGAFVDWNSRVTCDGQ